jgi:alpha-methylacyl-CoA racemase
MIRGTRKAVREPHSAQGPLAGLRVVEFAGLGPGPFSAMLLADAGAEVVRIQRDATDPGPGPLVRGRTLVPADLKTDAGHRLARELVAHADVLLEGFRPGVMERLGLGPEVCLLDNPRLVYGRVTGWGRGGPLAHTAGHDINYLAVTGALHSIRRAGHPPVPPLNLVADYGGGGLLLTFGVLTALHERATSGRGQVVDAAMLDGVSLLMTGIWSRLAEGRWPGRPGHNELDGGAPFYTVYATADEEYMAVGAIEPQFWERLLQVLALNPANVPDQWDRARWPELTDRIATVFRTRTRAVWTDAFTATDACVSPVRSLAEAVQDPQMRARDTLINVNGVIHPAPAPQLSRTPMRPPSHVQHNRQLSRETGDSSPALAGDVPGGVATDVAAVLARWHVPTPCRPVAATGGLHA